MAGMPGGRIPVGPLAADVVDNRVRAFAREAEQEATDTLRGMARQGSESSFALQNTRQLDRLPIPPWLERLGTALWNRSSPFLHLELIWLRRGVDAAIRFLRIIVRLHRKSSRITEAIRLDFLDAFIEDVAGRTVKIGEYLTLVKQLVNKASEHAAVYHTRFLAIVDDEAEKVRALARNPDELKRLGLVSLEDAPLLCNDVWTVGLSDAAQRQFVDLLVMFRGRAPDGTYRYLPKIRVQVKISRVGELVSRMRSTGEVQIGQILSDQLRAGRGMWHFGPFPIEQSQLILDERHTTLVTIASRDLTSRQMLQLAMDTDGVEVEHLLHEVPRDELYAWAAEVLRLARVRIK